MKSLLIFVCLLIFFAFPALSQSDLDIYGYVQTVFEAYQNQYSPHAPDGEANYHFNVVGISQANIMLSKGIADKFTTFINLEFINNYSSANKWGSFALQEAYIRWDAKDYLRVKVGLALPMFNNFLEIYNRTPLVPYLLRPKLYAVDLGNLIDFFNIMPQKSLLQVSGVFPMNDWNLDYAVYLLAPVNRSFSSTENDIIPGYVSYGQPATTDVGIGGRFGVRYSDIKAGISFTRDKENQTNFVYNDTLDPADLGYMPRYRLGGDLSFAISNFSFAAEFLVTNTIMPQDVKDSLNVWHDANPYFIGNSFTKYFYYASIQYDFTDELYAFVLYDNLMDETDPFYFGLDGYAGISIGGGYRVNESLILKIQLQQNYSRYEIEPGDVRDYKEYIPAIGLSFSF